MLKPIKGYPGYVVSDEGYVIGIRGKRIGYINNAGYMTVHLKNEHGWKQFLVHRIVAETFVSGCTEEHNAVDHRDGNKLNNQAGNLRWTSKRKNVLYAYNEQNLFQERQRPKPLVLHDPDTDTWHYFTSIHDASVKLGLPYWHLNDVYHGKRKRVKGYKAYPVGIERERTNEMENTRIQDIAGT